MGALLLALVLGGAPAQEALWRRELGRLEAVLAEGGEEEGFFGEVVGLFACRRLPALPELDAGEAGGPPLTPALSLGERGSGARELVLRRLLRVEEARRARLGEAARSAPTVWREVLAPDAFALASPSGQLQGPTLHWPEESERWPDEVLQRPPLSRACDTPLAEGGSELPLLTPSLLAALDAEPLLSPVAARAAYQRAVLLTREGRVEEATVAWEAVRPKALEEALRPHARLGRFAFGHAGADEGLRLLQETALAKARPWLAARVCLLQLQAAQADEALAVREVAGPSPLSRVLRACHVAALRTLGRTEEALSLALSAFPNDADPQEEGAVHLRQQALALLARQPPARLPQLEGLVPAPQREHWLGVLGGVALDAGNLAMAEAAAAALAEGPSAPARVRAHTLRLEAALLSGDVRRFEVHAAALAAPVEARAPRATREARERALLALAHALVARLADEGGGTWRARVHGLLAALAPTLAREDARTVGRLADSLSPGVRKAGTPLAVGTLSVAVPSALPPLPTLAHPFPEAFSLLALPGPDGTFHDWLPPRNSDAP